MMCPSYLDLPVHRSYVRPGGIEFIEHFAAVGGRDGGYNEDHESFGYRQSI